MNTIKLILDKNDKKLLNLFIEEQKKFILKEQPL